MSTICIIPARGGSKRLPRKNILPLGGKPLLTRVVETALKAGSFDRVVVSSDDDEMLSVARGAGAEGHRRPDALGADRVGVVQVCLEVLDHCEASSFCCIYATAALLKPETVRASAEVFRDAPDAHVLMGVSRYNYHPVQALKVGMDGYAEQMFPDYKGVQSQFYYETRVSNGTLYWARRDSFREEKSFYSPRMKVFDIDDSEVCDLDTPEDYQVMLDHYGAG